MLMIKQDVKWIDWNGDCLQVRYYLLSMFESSRKDRKRPFFYHFTTAVDTENIRRVFQDCRAIILEQNLKSLMMQ